MSAVWPYPQIVAHRGGGTAAPENTLLAISTGGIDRGIGAVEFDVMLTADGVPMLMHDDIMGRTVTAEELKGRHFDELTAAEAAQLDVSSWFGGAISTICNPPLLMDVLQFCRENNIWMNIEIKPCEGKDEETGRVVGEMVGKVFPPIDGASRAPVHYPLFSSFSFAALKAAKESAPHICRGFLIDNIPLEAPSWKQQLDALDAVALHTNHEHLTEELTSAIRAAGFAVFCYTVNDLVDAARLMQWGVQGICTDKIDEFAALASKLKKANSG